MKIVSWNVRGMGDQMKRVTVKDILCNYRIDVRLIQETKLSSVTEAIIKEIWGSSVADNWICCGIGMISVRKIGGSRNFLLSSCLKRLALKPSGFLLSSMVLMTKANIADFGTSLMLFEISGMVPGA